MTDAMTPAQLGDAKELAFLVAASNFVIEYSARAASRDSDSDSPDDTSDASEAALRIDPSRIYNSAKRNEVIDAFGTHPFAIHSDLCYVTKSGNSVTVYEYDRLGTTVFRKTIPQSELLRMSSGDDGDQDADEEFVTIRIKTGKGGRACFRVRKRDAKDMVGCD